MFGCPFALAYNICPCTFLAFEIDFNLLFFVKFHTLQPKCKIPCWRQENVWTNVTSKAKTHNKLLCLCIVSPRSLFCCIGLKTLNWSMNVEILGGGRIINSANNVYGSVWHQVSFPSVFYNRVSIALDLVSSSRVNNSLPSCWCPWTA